jgi:transcriptional regulator with GAF, ATPase, and Fis domain
MAGLAEDLQRALTCDELAAALLAAAVGLVPGAERGSVCLRRGRLPGLRTDPVVSTDALTDALEVLQRRLGQGPSMDALHERTPVLVADLAAEQHRWPVLSAHAKTQDVSSAMCLPLTVAGEHFGSLNLFAAAEGAFDHTSQHAGVLLSMHAAIAAAHLHAVRQLHSALEHRDVIGQAKGILVERHKLHPDQAFGVLSTVSQNSNCKLHEVARELTTTGALPSRR